MTSLDGKQIRWSRRPRKEIGRATAEAFAREGAHVWATDVNLDEARRAEFDSWNHDAPVGRAGYCGRSTIRLRNGADRGTVQLRGIRAQRDGAGLHRGAMGCRFRSECEESRCSAPSLHFCRAYWRRAASCVINMSSVASSIKGVPSRFAYTTTKAAVIGLTKSVAADYVGKGIRCNAICPGTVNRHRSKTVCARWAITIKLARRSYARQPIGRIRTPEEIANLAVYLATALPTQLVSAISSTAAGRFNFAQQTIPSESQASSLFAGPEMHSIVKIWTVGRCG